MDLFFCRYAKNGMLQSDFDKILLSFLILYSLNIILVWVIIGNRSEDPYASPNSPAKKFQEEERV